ncbi:hypothetical protein BHYA_0190g00290 [Botrytis hyacinthi]|uniref:Uncharacterized protein n=1 Tax=Botrytis hyacinthi TaxID=278943 RepID=A0A4Z1GJF2_9HELO|nr:hypothetical protein BHYA_0190g00290 [Botrytis hyacinthi]
MDASRRVSLVAIGYSLDSLLIDKDATVGAEFNGPKRRRRGRRRSKKWTFFRDTWLEIGRELEPEPEYKSCQQVMNKQVRVGEAGKKARSREGNK